LITANQYTEQLHKNNYWKRYFKLETVKITATSADPISYCCEQIIIFSFNAGVELDNHFAMLNIQ